MLFSLEPTEVPCYKRWYKMLLIVKMSAGQQVWAQGRPWEPAFSDLPGCDWLSSQGNPSRFHSASGWSPSSHPFFILSLVNSRSFES